MQAIPLLIALLFAAPADAGEFENDIAIALALNADVPIPQSVVKEAPKAAAPKFTTKQVTKTRWTRKKICHGRWCEYKLVPEKYTETVKAPVSGDWPHYPTTNKSIWRLNGGKGPKPTWKHLTEGEHKGKFDTAWLQTLSDAEINALHADDHEHKVKWANVVRP